MSYQPLFLGLGTAVVRTTEATGYLEAETANLTVGQPIVFEASNNSPLVGGLESNTLHFVKEIIDGNNFTVSATLNGAALPVTDDTGFMLVRAVQKENTGDSLRKIDEMLEELYAGGLGGDGVGILSVSADTTPQLGGNLNLSNFSITGTGSIDIAGSINATKFSGGFNGILAGGLTGPVNENGVRIGNPSIDGLDFELGNPVGGDVIAWDAPNQKFVLVSVSAVSGTDTLDDVLFRGNTSSNSITVSSLTTDTLTVNNGINYAAIVNPPSIPADISDLTDNQSLLSQGVNLGSRLSSSAVTGALLVNAIGNISIVGFRTYALMSMNVEIPAWVRIYTSAAARSADAARLETEDPLPGSGVLAEVITTTENETVYFTPATIGFNNDIPLSTTVYLAVKNKGSGLATIQVTLTLLQLEV